MPTLDASPTKGADLLISEVAKDYVLPGGELRRAVGPVSLSIPKGRFVVVVGPSGCGKTTLLRLLARMIEPSSGKISLHSDDEASADRIGMVFQTSSLYPWRTLAQNVTFGMELKANNGATRPSAPAMRERASELLTLVGLKAFEDYYPHQVSGGMQQRVNLARALAIHPTLLLMDEPFSALDAQTREELQVELQRIAVQAAPTTVFVTHDIREAVFLADTVVVLSKNPGVVQAVINVQTPRPRPLRFQVSTEFVELSKEVWRQVHPGVRTDEI